MNLGVRGLVVAVAVQLGAGTAVAQAFRFVPTVQPEVTAGIIGGARSVVVAGAGLNVPAGYYVRAAAIIAAGRELGANPGTVGRAELAARFLADPFAEWRWGPYAGAGIAVEAGEGRRSRMALIFFVGTEIPRRTGWVPAVELGFGGGARLAVVLRRTRRAGR